MKRICKILRSYLGQKIEIEAEGDKACIVPASKRAHFFEYLCVIRERPDSLTYCCISVIYDQITMNMHDIDVQ